MNLLDWLRQESLLTRLEAGAAVFFSLGIAAGITNGHAGMTAFYLILTLGVATFPVYRYNQYRLANTAENKQLDPEQGFENDLALVRSKLQYALASGEAAETPNSASKQALRELNTHLRKSSAPEASFTLLHLARSCGCPLCRDLVQVLATEF